jgi:hypothetical protein
VQVTLTTGVEVDSNQVFTTTALMQGALKRNFNAAKEIVKSARDPEYAVSPATRASYKELFNEKGSLHSSTAEIIRAAVTGEDDHLKLVNPVSDGKTPPSGFDKGLKTVMPKVWT